MKRVRDFWVMTRLDHSTKLAEIVGLPNFAPRCAPADRADAADDNSKKRQKQAGKGKKRARASKRTELKFGHYNRKRAGTRSYIWMGSLMWRARYQQGA